MTPEAFCSESVAGRETGRVGGCLLSERTRAHGASPCSLPDVQAGDSRSAGAAAPPGAGGGDREGVHRRGEAQGGGAGHVCCLLAASPARLPLPAVLPADASLCCCRPTGLHGCDFTGGPRSAGKKGSCRGGAPVNRRSRKRARPPPPMPCCERARAGTTPHARHRQVSLPPAALLQRPCAGPCSRSRGRLCLGLDRDWGPAGCGL